MNPTREQLTAEKVNELIIELGEAGIIHEDEAGDLTTTRDFTEARSVRESTPKPAAVTRSKVSSESHREFSEALDAGNTEDALAHLWHVLTGVDIQNGEREDL